MIERLRPEAVIHLAWSASGDPGYRRSDDNARWVEATIELYEICRKNDVRLWATGTGVERHDAAGDAYTRSKATLRRHLADEIDRGTLGWLRPYYVFDQVAGRPALFAEARRARERGEKLILRDPDSEHDFVHAQDVAAALFVALQHGLMGELPIGFGVTHRVSDCADALGVEWTSAQTTSAESTHAHEPAEVGRLKHSGGRPPQPRSSSHMARAETPEQPSSHGDYVPDAAEYATARAEWRGALGADQDLRRQAVALQVAAEGHRFTYQWEWAGVPIIRLPDDVMVLQELVWDYRPQKIVETGVARGGSMLLDASLMRMAGLDAAVLGIDHKIYPHTREAMAEHPMAQGVTLLEADSSSTHASEATSEFLGSSERAILILDSNHTHDHVLAELRALAPLLPAGGYVLVADTLVEEFPEAPLPGATLGTRQQSADRSECILGGARRFRCLAVGPTWPRYRVSRWRPPPRRVRPSRRDA